MLLVFKRILKFFFSMSFGGMLLLVYAFSIGFATFVENDFGIQTARAIIYNAWWFEALHILLMINCLGVLWSFQSFKIKKLPIVLVHMSLFIIILGGGITRYFSDEGVMHIRENKSNNVFVSEKTYIQGSVWNGNDTVSFKESVLFSRLGNNHFQKSIKVGNEKVFLTLQKIIPNASKVVVFDSLRGAPIISIITGGANGRKTNFLAYGEKILLNEQELSFGRDDTPISIWLKENQPYILSKSKIETLRMADQQKASLTENTEHPLQKRTLYSIGTDNFVFQNLELLGSVKYVPMPHDNSNPNGVDALKMSLKNKKTEKEITLIGGKGLINNAETTKINDLSARLEYGSITIPLSFSLYLNDFILDRYPGSESPASFKSRLTLIDPNTGLKKDIEVYMNNVLHYGGYRFYQASYDPDERGTILSVNRDTWGTLVSYIGYTILFSSLLLSLFINSSYFHLIGKKLRQNAPKALIILPFIAPKLGLADDTTQQSTAHFHQAEKAIEVSEDRATAFGKLLCQTENGRIIPINTHANNLLRKIYRKDHFNRLNAEQVFLGMIIDPIHWQKQKIIKIENKETRKLLGIEGKYADFISFFKGGDYVIKSEVEKAYRQKPSLRTKFQKELIKIDERVNICYMVYTGYLLKIFPIPNDSSNRWISPISDDIVFFSGADSLFVVNIVRAISHSLKEQNTDLSQKLIGGIAKFQKQYGSSIIPSSTKIQAEIFYNRINIFYRLFPYYIYLGLALLILFLIQIFSPQKRFKTLRYILTSFLLLFFGTHTFGLGLRWYISGHAPWSDGYESMIYIAWTTVLAGIIFSNKSFSTLSVASIMSGVTLMVAHLNWMDPEITNLVPVLKSYWLMIHVSVITASYGFFGLGFLLGIISMIVRIFSTKKTYQRVQKPLKNLTFTNEMTLTVGLVLLTIGNFLGAVWANESWGRYWSWDPKETWALVTIIVYAFIIHIRKIPPIKDIFIIDLAAIVGFASVIMTYFGVNFYLSGLHSYAKGDPPPLPNFIYVIMGIIFLLCCLAAIREQKSKA